MLKSVIRGLISKVKNDIDEELLQPSQKRRKVTNYQYTKSMYGKNPGTSSPSYVTINDELEHRN